MILYSSIEKLHFSLFTSRRFFNLWIFRAERVAAHIGNRFVWYLHRVYLTVLYLRCIDIIRTTDFPLRIERNFHSTYCYLIECVFNLYITFIFSINEQAEAMMRKADLVVSRCNLVCFAVILTVGHPDTVRFVFHSYSRRPFLLDLAKRKRVFFLQRGSVRFRSAWNARNAIPTEDFQRTNRREIICRPLLRVCSRFTMEYFRSTRKVFFSLWQPILFVMWLYGIFFISVIPISLTQNAIFQSSPHFAPKCVQMLV